jgi:hypothetical protein
MHHMKRVFSTLLLLGAAVACSEESPTRPDDAGAVKPVRDPSSQIALLSCVASKSELTVTCAEPQLPGRNRDGPVMDIIYGGQNTFVTVTSSNVAYNSGTGRFTFDVTLRNLLQQPIGTTDGTTLAPTGVRVFFASGPTVTGGSGVCAVLPDGFGTFTGAGQSFYQYDQVLALNQTSSAKQWTIIISPTVDTFTFLLLISAPVQFPTGYIEINGQLPVGSYGLLHPGSTAPLTGVVKNQLGIVIPGAVITWGTTDPNQAIVDASGVVTGVRYGTPAITATSMGLNGSILFNITGTIRDWTGAVSTDWENGGNWAGGYTPALVDTANVPIGVPNFPVLTQAVATGGFTVADAATLSLGAFNMTLTSLAAAGQATGGVSSTNGQLILSGNSVLHGLLPTTVVTGTYLLDANARIVASLAIDAGTIQTDSHTLQVDSQ